MADQASEFVRQSQAMAEQSWAQWMRYLQQAAGQPTSPMTGFGMPGMPGMAGWAGMPGMSAPAAPMGDMLERSLAGISSYLEWMQRAATAQAAPIAPGTDWQAAMKDMFGAAGQPFAQAFEGIDSTAAQGFVQQWQTWLAAAGQAGATDWRTPSYMPGFGLHREQQSKQQALVAAMMESAEQQRRYQALILKANAAGLERLQDRLADHIEPGRQLESLKSLYDLWVDAAEEAYAEIALSDEFREVYGAMVNAQMCERQLVQAHLEDLCRQLGLPTRSEIDSLGRRLQEVRRELRAIEGGAVSGELAELRAELQALRKAQPVAAQTHSGGTPAARAGSGKSKEKTEVGARATPEAAPKKRAAPKRASAKSATKAASAEKARSGKAAAKPSTASPVAAKDSRKKRTASRVRRAAAVKSGAGSRRTLVSPGIPAPHRARRK